MAHGNKRTGKGTRRPDKAEVREMDKEELQKMAAKFINDNKWAFDRLAQI